MRPTKLTPELTKLICEKLRKTLPIEKVCDLVGIDESTFYDWVHRGEAAVDGDELFVEFSKSVKKARAEAQEFWLEVLTNSTVEKSFNPNAAFFVLERSDRKNWGRQQETKVEIAKVDYKKIMDLAKPEPEAN